MGFFRIRTTVDERPGRLASLAGALAERGGNILGLSVQSDADGTVDEFLADIPAPPEDVRRALEAAGGRSVRVVPATAHELTDEPTRALLLASRLRAAPWMLPQILADLLRADDARWVYGAAAGEPREQERPGTPASAHPSSTPEPCGPSTPSADTSAGKTDGRVGWRKGRSVTPIDALLRETRRVVGRKDPSPSTPESAHGVELPDPTLLTVPVAARRAIRLRRAGLPFTLTEAARAAAFVRLAQPPEDPVDAERPLRLADGTEVTVRPLTPIYRAAVHDLHERCSPQSRRFRYLTARPTLPPHVFDRLCDRNEGRSLVAGYDGQVVALASLIFTSDPGVAELALLVQDRWQGRGLGTALARMLLREARDLGFAEVKATLLPGNTRMRRLLTSLGAVIGPTDDPGMLEARLPTTRALPIPA